MTNLDGDISLDQQLALVTELYEEMLTHHGARIGVRHARKHLGWALDAAAETAGVAAEPIGPTELKGLDEPVVLSRLSDPAAPDTTRV